MPCKLCKCPLPYELLLWCPSTSLNYKNYLQNITWFSSLKAPEPEMEKNCMKKSQHVFVVIKRGWSNHIKRVLVYNHLRQWQVLGFQDRVTALIHSVTRTFLEPRHLPGTSMLRYNPSFHDTHSLCLSP